MELIKGIEHREKIMEMLSGRSSIIIDTDPLSIYNEFHPPFSFPIPAKDVMSVVSRPDLMNENIMIFSSIQADLEFLMGIDLPSNVKIIYDNTDRSWSRYYPFAYYKSIDAWGLYTKIGEFSIIDIREEFELFSGFIEGSINIPFSRIMQEPINLDKGKRYAVICAHGNRSRVAIELLSSMGLDVYDVAGGMQRWLEAGLPVSYEED
ncbi:rhodanese-like domain-containing protein [Thermoplasma sp.]|uniref:rhodanese-like domain-containing protein n=1 Tax=Thermoplasma sp. TaxID=1973142 RepID=UPI00127ECCC3|nr:rhodanese-like domain-containing protein [Thermoplasma sp.]KAA8923532.1 MAG: rhodanese-like domain-containing protein [Thermoplasma sp.]